MKHVVTLAVLALFLPPAALWADDNADALIKQKADAEANWKKMEFGKDTPPVHETPNLLVYSRLSEAKTKSLASGMEKILSAALKPLKYDAMDRPWTGKLTVYVLKDRGEFVEFMRKIVRKSPEDDEVGTNTISGDTATITVGAPRTGMEEPDEIAQFELSNVLLKRKLGGAEPPSWLVTGFARASVHRATNKTAKAASAPNILFKDLWNEKLNPQVIAKAATYFVDFMAYGPMSDSFTDFVNALRPGENDAKPMAKDVYDAIKMDEQTFEYCARHWKKPPTPKTPIKPKDKP